MQIIQSKSIKYPPPYTQKEKINAEKKHLQILVDFEAKRVTSKDTLLLFVPLPLQIFIPSAISGSWIYVAVMWNAIKAPDPQL